MVNQTKDLKIDKKVYKRLYKLVIAKHEQTYGFMKNEAELAITSHCEREEKKL